MTNYSENQIFDAMSKQGFSAEDAAALIAVMGQSKRKRGRPRKKIAADRSEPKPKRRRGAPPKTFKSKQKILLWYVYLTAGIPNRGVYYNAKYRSKIDLFLAEALGYKDLSTVRHYTKIWRSFEKKFNSGEYEGIFFIHLDDRDVIGSRVTHIDQIFDENSVPNPYVIGTLTSLALHFSGEKPDKQL